MSSNIGDVREVESGILQKYRQHFAKNHPLASVNDVMNESLLNLSVLANQCTMVQVLVKPTAPFVLQILSSIIRRLRWHKETAFNWISSWLLPLANPADVKSNYYFCPWYARTKKVNFLLVVHQLRRYFIWTSLGNKSNGTTARICDYMLCLRHNLKLLLKT